MAAPTRVCPSCQKPLPEEAVFCPSCGEATPMEISGDTGQAQTSETVGTDDHDYHKQLQRALGDGYELRDVIGQGGFGTVYLAWDRPLARAVAVKTIRPELAAWPGFLKQFRREAQILAQIRHPNVVEVFAFGEDDQLAFMVMPLVSGNTLAQHIAEQCPMPVPDVMPIMRGVANGLIAAHGRGIIHRDVKPANIIWDPETTHWRIMDFGIARAEQSALRTLTTAPTPIGTPLYMSPEQVEDPKGTDHRADIYGYGATFYEALTGRPPFDGESILAVAVMHKIEPLVAPRSVNPDIPEKLNDCVERCLAKQPVDRFQSFQEVLLSLDPSGRSAWDLPTDPTTEPFLSRYRERRNVYLSATASQLPNPDIYELPDARVLQIGYGDITTERVDAVVSSDDNMLCMNGGVSGQIRAVGGEGVCLEAKRFIPVRPGRVVVTTAGDLPARFVLHGVTLGFGPKYGHSSLPWAATVTPSRDLISEIVEGCFYHGDTLDLQSIAFPLLGTGAGGFSREVCLDTMFRVLLRKLLQGVSSVKEVRIVLFPM